MTKEETLQFYLDMQGHIVIWSERKREKGEVVEGLRFNEYGEVPHAVVVIGPATRAEYLSQCAIFNSTRFGADAPFFHKVIAE